MPRRAGAREAFFGWGRPYHRARGTESQPQHARVVRGAPRPATSAQAPARSAALPIALATRAAKKCAKRRAEGACCNAPRPRSGASAENRGRARFGLRRGGRQVAACSRPPRDRRLRTDRNRHEENDAEKHGRRPVRRGTARGAGLLGRRQERRRHRHAGACATQFAPTRRRTWPRRSSSPIPRPSGSGRFMTPTSGLSTPAIAAASSRWRAWWR